MTRLWTAAWIFLGVWFLAWEIAALLLGRPDLTLSDFAWRLEGTGWTLGRYAVLAFLVWATLHLTFRMFR